MMAKEHPDDIFHECETEEDIRQLARNYSYANVKLKATMKEMEKKIDELTESSNNLCLELQMQDDQTGYALAKLGETFHITLAPIQGA